LLITVFQCDLKAVENWTGDIKSIRYKTGDMMGTTVTIATAYYADNPDNKDEILAVVLSSTDKKNWVMLAGGLSSESKAEFEKMSLTLESSDAVSEKEEPKNFTLEMANGDKFSDVNEASILKCVKKLNDDNFFVILSNEDDYMQAAFSDMGFIIQYSENGQQLEAEEYFTEEQTVDILKKYFHSDMNWKEENKWVSPSY